MRETAGIIRCSSSADASPFIVIDRKGPGSNLEEKWLEAANWLRVAPDGTAAANPDITAKAD